MVEVNPNVSWTARKLESTEQKSSDKRIKDPGLWTAGKSLQSCPPLCEPIDGSPPGSPVPGILLAGTLEWVVVSFSNA